MILEGQCGGLTCAAVTAEREEGRAECVVGRVEVKLVAHKRAHVVVAGGVEETAEERQQWFEGLYFNLFVNFLCFSSGGAVESHDVAADAGEQQREDPLWLRQESVNVVIRRGGGRCCSLRRGENCPRRVLSIPLAAGGGCGGSIRLLFLQLARPAAGEGAQFGVRVAVVVEGLNVAARVVGR